MKDYWFTINDIDRYVNVVFRNSNFNLINIIFHMVDIAWLEEVRDGIKNTAAPDNNHTYFKKTYGNCTIMTTRDYASLLLMQDRPRAVCVKRSLFTGALEGYISLYHQHISES